MYITMCLYITITIPLWVLSIYPIIKHYIIVVSIITVQLSQMYRSLRNMELLLCHFICFPQKNNFIKPEVSLF